MRGFDKNTMLAICDSIEVNDLKSLTNMVCQFHRIKGDDGMLSAMKLLQKEFKDVPGSSSKIRLYQASESSSFGTWSQPPDWSVKNCALSFKPEPDTTPHIILSTDRSNFGVFSYSGRVSPESSFNLIREDSIPLSPSRIKTHRQSIPDPANTVVFMKDYNHYNACHLTQTLGYRGLITAPSSEKYKDDTIMLNARHWHRAPITGQEDLSHPDSIPFGFSLTPTEGNLLENYLTRCESCDETAEIRVTLDTEFSTGPLPVLEIIVDGGRSRSDYVVVTAHICHPGPSADDNASGIATAVMLAKVMAETISDPSCETGLIVLIVPENLGTMAWLLNPSVPLDKIRAGINFDMTAADPVLAGAKLYTVAPPFFYKCNLATTGFNALKLARTIMEQSSRDKAPAIELDEYGFSIGSDNQILNFPDFNIPTIGFICWPDRFYHTDADTPERLNYHVMKQVILAGAITLMELIQSKAPAQITIPDQLDQGVDKHSDLNFDSRLLRRIPSRNYPGPLYRAAVYEMSNGMTFSTLDEMGARHDYEGMTTFALAEMLIDGKRSLGEIQHILQTQGVNLDIKAYRVFLDQLEQLGLISYQ